MNLSLAALIGASALVCACAGTPMDVSDDPAPLVEAPAGAVRGVREGVANVFRAIPYASPPVGERRWRPPTTMPRWNGVRAAQAPGVACMQPPMAPGPYNRGQLAMSEDASLAGRTPAEALQLKR